MVVSSKSLTINKMDKDVRKLKFKEEFIMIINHNMNAMNAHRNMSSNTVNAGKSMEKLSSGLRINKAGDDAAGLAISEKMRGQIRGLDQAARNGQDGISLIQTAEGSLNETHSILQRMRELAVQSANDTNTDTDRTEIQKEVDQLATEITRISNTTEFNTKNLAGGGFDQTFHIGANEGQSINLSISAMDAKSLGVTSDVLSPSAKMGTDATDTGLKGIDLADGAKLAEGTYTFVTEVKDDGAGADVNLYLKDANGEVVASLEGFDNSTVAAAGTVTLTANADYSGAVDITIQHGDTGFAIGAAIFDETESTITIGSTGLDVTSASTSVETMQMTSGKLADGTYELDIVDDGAGAYYATVKDGDGNLLKDATGAIAKVDVSTAGDFSLDVVDKSGNAATLEFSTLADVAAVETAEFTITNNTYKSGTSTIATADGETLSKNAEVVKGIDVSSSTAANEAVTKINEAIEKVSAERSKLGAVQNRLEHTIANLGTSSENLTAAESRVRDVDMAKEMMTFSKNNILSQAAQAMLAQANQQPQGVLQLLR